MTIAANDQQLILVKQHAQMLAPPQAKPPKTQQITTRQG